jgi:hypothetical protein
MTALKHNRYQPRLDILEDRTLLATGITANLQGNVLVVVGTEQNDVITLRRTGTSIEVEDGAAEAGVFQSSQVEQIQVFGRGGHDRIRLDSENFDGLVLAVNAYLRGGAGNDTVVGGAGTDRLIGDDGDDRLWGLGGNDLVYGARGNDLLYGGRGVDRLYGQDGNDRLYGGTHQDVLSGGTGSNLLFQEGDILPPGVEAPTPPPTPGLSAIEQAIINLVNQERADAGLAALRVNTRLVTAAAHHASNMVLFDNMSHTLPGSDAPTLTDRLQQAGYAYSAAGENIAWNYAGAQAVMDGWMTSSGHRANILSTTYTELGVAVRYTTDGEPYYCQVFGRPA